MRRWMAAARPGSRGRGTISRGGSQAAAAPRHGGGALAVAVVACSCCGRRGREVADPWRRRHHGTSCSGEIAGAAMARGSGQRAAAIARGCGQRGAGRGSPWAAARGAAGGGQGGAATAWAAARGAPPRHGLRPGAPWAADRGAAGLGHDVGCGQRRRGARPWRGLRPEGPRPGAAAAGRGAACRQGLCHGRGRPALCAAVQYLHGFAPNCFTNFVAFTFFQGLLSRDY
ncbi:spidroin-1-like [Panicum hallii]|uniref:spidroin-1-like n=1 Tax=Panicum hallii TaxID=206008 RepID=UPI000DF4CEE4|nr:spidroin-1-like [Panicum hallii]